MFFLDNSNSDYGLALVIFNVLVYLYLSIGIFWILLLVGDKSYSTLNKLKNLNEFYFLFLATLLLLLSLAGVPPLLGFAGKFLLYIQLLAYKSYYLFTLFLLFNVFILYFYIQNIRFMVSKTPNKTKMNIFSTSLSYEYNFAIILFILFFNLFGIFYFEHFLNYIIYILSI